MQDATSLDQTDRNGVHLTFKLGNAHFALDVACIRYITSRDAIKPRMIPDTDHHNHEVFQYQDSQIPLFRFSNMIKARSQHEQSAELVKLLQQRRQDHIDWINALEDSICSDTEFTKATDPSQCAFGMWYDHYQAEDEELAQILAKFDAPHRRIHSLAEKLLHLAKHQHNPSAAMEQLEAERTTTLRDLLKLFEQATDRLHDLQKPVVLILHTTRKEFAIELDSVNGIIDFNDSQWLADLGQDTELHPGYDGFYQQDDGQLFIKLNPLDLLRHYEEKSSTPKPTLKAMPKKKQATPAK